MRKPDGRTLEVHQYSPELDTVNQYDVAGDLISVTTSSQGTVVSRETREYDNAHNLVARCVALTQSTACDELLAPTRTSYSTSRSPNSAADRQLFTYRYDNEDRLIGEVDALGLETTYQRDELGRVEVVLVEDTYPRTLSLTRDGRGNVTQAVLAASGISLTSSFEYDGFDRLSATTDRRGLRWEHSFDPLGRRSHSVAVNAPALREQRWAHNGFGDLVSERTNGVIEQTYTDLNNDGLAEVVQATGGGITERRFDSQGNILWQRSPDGTDQLLVLDPSLYQHEPCGVADVPWSQASRCRRVHRAVIHRNMFFGTVESTRAVSTTTLTHLDGFEYASTISGHAVTSNDPYQVETVRDRTAMGHIAREWTRLGANETYSDTSFTRNLAGWVTGTVKTIDEGTSSADQTTHELNAAGQAVQTTDPTGATVEQYYDEAGRLRHIIRPAANTSGVTIS